MAKRDVELVVKAKDEATRSLKKISGALQTLETDQKDLAKSSDSAGKTLGQLGAAVKKLEAQAQVGAALGTLTKSIDTTNKSLINQRNELSKTESEMVNYAAKLVYAKEALDNLQNGGIVGPKTKAQNKQLVADIAAAESAIKKIELAYDKSAISARNQTVAIEKSEGALYEIEKSSIRAVASLNQEGEAVDKLVRRLARLKAEASAQRTFKATAISTEVPVLNQGNAQAQARQAKEDYLGAVTALSTLQAELRNTQAPTVELGNKIGVQRARVIELSNSYRALAAAASDQIILDKAHAQALGENALVTRAAKVDADQLTKVERAHAETLGINARMTREAAKAMEVAHAEALRMNQAFDSAKIRQATKDLNLLHAEALKMNKAFDMNKANSSFGGLINNIKKLNGESRESLGIFERMRGQILAVGASYVGVFGAANLTSGLFDAQRAMDGIIAKFTVGFGGDKNKAAQEFEFVKKVANDLGLDLKSLANDYSQLTVSTVGTNLEGQRTRDIFLSVAKASRVLNLSADDTSGIIKALTQIVSKGTVMSEELRGQIGERLPGALQLMANGTKVTTKELLKLMEQGKLSSEALVNFARALSEKVSPGVDAASKTASASVLRLGNAWFELQGKINQSGLMDAMGKSIDEMVGVLRDPATIQAIVQFAKALGEVVVSVVKFIKNNPDTIINSLKILVGLLTVKIAGGLITGLADFVMLLPKFISAVTAARGALLLFSPALAALVGPVGWLVLAAAAVGLFVYNLTKVPDAAAESAKKVSEMTNSLQDLTRAQREGQRISWESDVEEWSKQLADVKKKLDAATDAQDANNKSRMNGSGQFGGNMMADVQVAKVREEYTKLKTKIDDTKKAIEGISQLNMKEDFSKFDAEQRTTPVDDKVVGVTEGVDKKAAAIAEKIRKQNEEFETRFAMLLAKDSDNDIQGTLDAYSAAIDKKYEPAYELLVKGGKARNSEEAKVIDKLVVQEKLIGSQKIEARDLAAQVRARNEAEKKVNDIVALRELIQNRITFLQKQGAPVDQVDKLKTQINDLDVTLKKTITDAIALYQPLADLGDIDAETTIQKLKIIEGTLGEIKDKSALSAEQINQDFAGSAASSLTEFGKSLGKIAAEGGNLSNVFVNARDAFRSFAADFLTRIAEMIIQQAILRALQSSSGGSIGGAIAGAIGAMSHHEGGTVGSGGTARAASPGWFSNAVKYHTGGVVGLKPDEVPAILQKGEEVLTRQDPRNRANAGGGDAGSMQNIKVINTIDSNSILNEALSNQAGTKILLNAIKANRSSMKQILT